MAITEDALVKAAATLTQAMIGRHAGKTLTDTSPEDLIAVTVGIFDDVLDHLRQRYVDPEVLEQEAFAPKPKNRLRTFPPSV